MTLSLSLSLVLSSHPYGDCRNRHVCYFVVRFADSKAQQKQLREIDDLPEYAQPQPEDLNAIVESVEQMSTTVSRIQQLQHKMRVNEQSHRDGTN